MTRFFAVFRRDRLRAVRPAALALVLAPLAALTVATGQETQPQGSQMRPGSQSTMAGRSEPVEGGMTKREAEEFYAMQVISMMNVAAEIRAGRCAQVLERIESSLPAGLEEMTKFEQTPATVAALNSAIKYYQHSGRPVPAFLAGVKDRVQSAVAGLESKDCYAFKKCSCLKLWSPEGVDVNKPDPYGWRYLIGSHCGFHFPKIWKMDCGEPVGVELCNGEYPEGSSMGGETTPQTWTGGTPATWVDGRLVKHDAATGRFIEVNRMGTETGKVFTQGANGRLIEIAGGAAAAAGSMSDARSYSAPALPEGAIVIGDAVRPINGAWHKIDPGTGAPLARWDGRRWAGLAVAGTPQAAGATGDKPSSATLESAAARYEGASGGSGQGAAGTYGTSGRPGTVTTQPINASTATAVKEAVPTLADPSGRRWQYATDPGGRLVQLKPVEAQRGTMSFVWNERAQAFVAGKAAAAALL